MTSVVRLFTVATIPVLMFWAYDIASFMGKV